MARIFCRDPEEDNRETNSAEDDGADGSAPIRGGLPVDTVPSRMFATPNGFCVVCDTRTPPPAAEEAPVEAEEGEMPEGQEAIAEGDEAAVAEAPAKPDRSWLVFFDQSATLCALYPGIATRVENGENALELFTSLNKKEMLAQPDEGPGRATLLGQAVDAAGDSRAAAAPPRRKSQTTSEGQKSDRVDKTVSLNATGTASALNQTSETIRSCTKQSAAPSAAEPPRLTAENLQKIGKSGSRRNLPTVSEGTGSKRGSVARATRLKDEAMPEAVRQAIPDFWQVGVRRNLRRSLEEKTLRQAGIRKRMEAMKKEVEGT